MIPLRVLNNEPPLPKAKPGLPLLALGFRPFFLLGGLSACLLIALWVASYRGWMALPLGLPPLIWHGHEMLFGFTMAVVAGFLLTAVPNWTSLPTPRGPILGALAVLWVLPRVLLVALPVPGLATAVLDLAFGPALAVAVGAPLVRAWQPRNLVFLPVLGFLEVANGLTWVEILGGPPTAWLGLQLGLLGVLMLITLIGGRVIPFFTERALPGARPRRLRWLEWATPGILVVLAASESLGSPAPALWLLAAILHGLRLALWYDARLWRVPLLWVLHLAYLWMAIGFALQALVGLQQVSPFLALHAFTVGCLGQMILGMMARVSLGHSGRELVAPRAVAVGFFLLNLAAALRSLVPWLEPEHYGQWVAGAGSLWCLAFLAFTACYAPILLTPRADGKPG